MAVYTTVTSQDLAAWLTRYAIGAVQRLEPIAEGIENTNYFVTADNGRFVLTLYERLAPDELPFYLNLMAHLAHAGVKAPAPEPDRSGALWSFLNGKPAGLVTRLDGRPVEHPSPAHCAEAGAALAQMHLAAANYRPRLSNRRGPGWWRQAARAVRAFLTDEQQSLMAAEIKFQASFAKTRLPRGAIHGDLFCDNVLFDGTRVSGIIDFGFAATDAFAYDLAIAVNDWCTVTEGERQGALEPGHVFAMVTAYDRLRPLNVEERTMWPVLLRAAGLRFWLSRLYDLHVPRQGELTHVHDPVIFERILLDRAAIPARFPDA